jgi:hypothetical protein
MQLYAQPYRSKALEPFTPKYPLQRSQIEDLRLAASKLLGATRRSFQAEMCLKYCGGSARLAETIFSWGRNNVELGLAEKRTGITCIGAQAAFGGNKSWEERQPEAAAALRQLAETHAQQDPTFETTIAYTRLTAAQAIEQLRYLGFDDEQVPAPSTMALILNRMGYRLRPVVKAKPQKKSRKPMPFSTTSKPTIGKSMADRSNA